jgi:HPt (histidine-containing phosphotransfer) domain-containing protein
LKSPKRYFIRIVFAWQFRQSEQRFRCETPAAHSLISANGFLGAKRLIELCNELQNLGETGAVEEAVPLLPVLETEFKNVCETLSEEMRKAVEAEITAV